MTESASSDAADTDPPSAPTGKKASKGVPPAFVIVVCLIVLIPYFYLNFFSEKQTANTVAKSLPPQSLKPQLEDEEAFLTKTKETIEAELKGKDAWQYHQRLSKQKQSLTAQPLAANEFRFLKDASSALSSSELDAFYQWTLSSGRIYDARLNKFENAKKVEALIQEWRQERRPRGPQ